MIIEFKPRANARVDFIPPMVYTTIMDTTNAKTTVDRVVSIADLQSDHRNANRGTPRGRAALERSLSQYGAGRSILLDKDNRIIAGNKTAQCAGEIGIDKVRIIETDGKEIIAVKRMDLNLDDKQARGLALADNRVGQLDLDWDAEELSRCAIEGVVDATMFTQKEIDDIVNKSMGAVVGTEDADPQIDKAEELRAQYGVEAGQVWQLGDHRILCGDCSVRTDVERVMQGERASCVFTDPPYGVSIGAKNRMLNSVQPSGRNLIDIVDDELTPEQLKARLLPAFVIMRELAMAEDCTVFSCAPQGGELGMMMMMMQEACLRPRHVLIWKKNAPTFSMDRLDYDYAHEPILLTWGKRHKRPMLGEHKTSVWEIDKPRSSKEHPTMKPVELYINAYMNNSERGDVVYEPYSGSGTAILAAENTGRLCRSIEIMPGYVAVAIHRWKETTGKEPKCLG